MKLKHRGNGTEDGEDGEGEYLDIPQTDTPENFTNETPTTYAFDDEGNLIELDAKEKDNDNNLTPDLSLTPDPSPMGEGSSKKDENDNENEDDKKGKKKDNADPDFTMVAAADTEEGDGIEHNDLTTPYDPKKDLMYYKYPTLDLLDKREDSNPQIDAAEQLANKNRIIHVLKSFGVEISSITATIGPTITLYEITPAEGMRISKIRNLEDDIALSLAAEGIRIIAPIPGKGTIGIEVPNKKKTIVSMYSILNSKTYQESKMELPCAMGKTITRAIDAQYPSAYVGYCHYDGEIREAIGGNQDSCTRHSQNYSWHAYAGEASCEDWWRNEPSHWSLRYDSAEGQSY